MRRAAAIAALLLTAGTAAAEQPVMTDPAHKRGLLDLPVLPQPGLPRTQYKRAQVVYRLPQELKDFAVRDATLSRLCQRGSFIQEKNGYYWAHTPGRAYGVAFSGGANLVDPQKQRQKAKVYFFDMPDARCTVWVGDQAKLMPHYVGPLPGD